MEPQDERDAAEAEEVLSEQETARPLVYIVVAVGAAMSVISVLLSSHGFSFAAVVVTLLALMPYLVFARLAMLQPGADAVIAGITLLAAGVWGTISYFGELHLFAYLAAYLLAIVLAVFGAGAGLRHVGGTHRVGAAAPPPEPEPVRSQRRERRSVRAR